MSNDIAISVSGLPSVGGVIRGKPSYLITLEQNSGKLKSQKFFITTEKPELLNGFVQVKGVFAENNETEETIIVSFSDILTNAKKELILELMLPWHKIVSIRSLVFRAK